MLKYNKTCSYLLKRKKNIQKPCFLGRQKSHNVNVYEKHKKLIIKQNFLQVHISLEKKGELYNTDHELLSEKVIVKRS